MTPTPTSETDWRLRPIVGLLSFAAAISVVGAVFNLPPVTSPGWLTLITITTLICLSSLLKIRIRPRFSINWTDSAILLAAATLPWQWTVTCVALGVTIAKVAQRREAIKSAFAVAKEVLVATTAGLILAPTAVESLTTRSQLDHFPRIEMLALAFVAMILVDELLSVPVIAISAGIPVLRMARDSINRHLLLSMIHFAVALAALVLLLWDSRLLIAVPPLVLSLHFMHMNRLRQEAEREAWQRLARATDALNEVDLDKVLRAAIDTGVNMFRAAWVELDFRMPAEPGEPAVLRQVVGDRTGLLPARSAFAVSEGEPTIVALEGQRDTEDVGELRLYFTRPTVLAEREGFLLQTFAAALATAIRNASAYGLLINVADQHAREATHDPLTGLANRRRLVHEGSAAFEQHPAGGAIALLTLDMVQFKEINDGLGYTAGDTVLVEIGRRMLATAGADAIVARQDGDEFAVLFTALPTPALAMHRSRDILQKVAEEYEVDGVPITLVPRAGLAVAQADGDMTELLRRASLALTEAKRTGQRIVPYSRSLDVTDLDRLELGGQISRAVAASEFTLEFQPIVDLATGEVVSAEALARWHHPDRGNLDPRRFLDAVERSGQLTAFTEAILDQALQAAGSWAAAGHPIPVAVNISPRSLLDRRFPALVKQVLDERGMKSESLVLELTESLTLSSLEIVDQVLAGLGQIGVAIALDDFGTGFSSLSALARVPVRELKIDRSFVTDMDASAEAMAVVRSTVELGRALGLSVVAEGIERVDQRQTLWNLGCGLGQGHLFARPLSQQRFLASLGKGAFGDMIEGRQAPVVRLPRAGEHFGLRRRPRSGNE
ncbi:MAG: bifunctional diguanylate cyclase/phosphodiesterase [Hamadaea sp.]|uniref:putative bifunctional diguanylate cyclase/phosphodiesterase n=1 Tax=Hamadaea sp. TaxID=2024425 RepID=UPI00182AF4A3|nr:bifunctional diguanylate cyclase/phosphodiesterase [Hamadaea sp.]NUR71227.1 bifunctional diguanylate cyclase/phosphodiesterase [Hamadaea sp.]NUT17758.1 bifunctional diguanylate cyclase/phosphodiesterase [Hamadaea sp.]